MPAIADFALPFDSATEFSREEWFRLSALYQVERDSPWPMSEEKVVPHLLPVKYGDGQQMVMLAFPNFPEVCVGVCFNSRLTLDVPLEERCRDLEDIRCLRDALPEIYAACQEIELGEDVIARVRTGSESDEADFNEWAEITEAGALWCPW